MRMNKFRFHARRRMAGAMLLLACALLLAACGAEQSGDEAAATPTWAPVPTFTATAVAVATEASAATPPPATPLPSVAEPDAVPPPTVAIVTMEMTPTQVLSATETTSSLPAETVSDTVVAAFLPTVTPEAEASAQPEAVEAETAQLTVAIEAANVRAGPGTDYAQIGVAPRDATYPITGRNEAGDWWQFCCIDEQPGWLFGELVTVRQANLVAVVAAPPTPVPPTAMPVAEAAPEATPAAAEPPAEVAPTAVQEAAPAPPVTNEHSGTAGNFDPNAQYQIVHYRVLGFADNNGGIFNQGGQHLIFITVLDQNGAGVDGAVLKDAIGDKVNIVTGNKGPGKTEIEMYWEPYKLYVASDPSGPVTSQVSNQMNMANPHIPDIVGLMGPADNEYAICPTIDDRCTPPFYHAHWSYEITFQKVK